MTLKQQQKQIAELQARITKLVDELRVTQHEIKRFKEMMSSDMKRAFEILQSRQAYMDDIEFPVNLPEGCNFDYTTKDSYYDLDYKTFDDDDLKLFDDYNEDDEE